MGYVIKLIIKGGFNMTKTYETFKLSDDRTTSVKIVRRRLNAWLRKRGWTLSSPAIISINSIDNEVSTNSGVQYQCGVIVEYDKDLEDVTTVPISEELLEHSRRLFTDIHRIYRTLSNLFMSLPYPASLIAETIQIKYPYKSNSKASKVKVNKIMKELSEHYDFNAFSDCVNNIPDPTVRQIMLLKFKDKMTTEDIARHFANAPEAAQISRRTINNNIQSGLTFLRSWLMELRYNKIAHEKYRRWRDLGMPITGEYALPELDNIFIEDLMISTKLKESFITLAHSYDIYTIDELCELTADLFRTYKSGRISASKEMTSAVIQSLSSIGRSFKPSIKSPLFRNISNKQ